MRAPIISGMFGAQAADVKRVCEVGELRLHSNTRSFENSCLTFTKLDCLINCIVIVLQLQEKAMQNSSTA